MVPFKSVSVFSSRWDHTKSGFSYSVMGIFSPAPRLSRRGDGEEVNARGEVKVETFEEESVKGPS